MKNKITIKQKTEPKEATYTLTVNGKKTVLTESELNQLREALPALDWGNALDRYEED